MVQCKGLKVSLNSANTTHSPHSLTHSIYWDQYNITTQQNSPTYNTIAYQPQASGSDEKDPDKISALFAKADLICFPALQFQYQ
ncbi:hypothetical protein L6164_011800 [Bauhinia variegata]|uniref:Uncharacterized protein n=1 Tax=Bauhinia variegata TaxID=167791 RepID=A0ACB9P743_BAUVA|nr:hypothetical protein L6164_011800 [Bauhinia variegata]